jgi:hypothetical protein
MGPLHVRVPMLCIGALRCPTMVRDRKDEAVAACG